MKECSLECRLGTSNCESLFFKCRLLLLAWCRRCVLNLQSFSLFRENVEELSVAN